MKPSVLVKNRERVIRVLERLCELGKGLCEENVTILVKRRLRAISAGESVILSWQVRARILEKPTEALEE